MDRDGQAASNKSRQGALWRTLRRASLSQRVRPVFLLIAGLMLIFGGQRAVLTLLKRPALGDLTDWTLVKLFLVGFRQDLRILSYLILPLAPPLSLAPNRWFAHRWLRAVIAWYITAVLVFAAAVCLVDALFFMQGDARLNWQAPSYVGEGEIVIHIWTHYPVILISLAVVLLIIAAFHLTRRYCLAGPPPDGPLWGRLTYGAVLTVLILLWAHHPAPRSEASSSEGYFSSNSLVSQLAFNPVATGGEALRDYITEGEAQPERYDLLPLSEAFVAARTALTQEHTVFAGLADNPLWRTVHTGRPRRKMNVVVVIMESFTGEHVGALGHAPSQSPFFDALTSKGVFFSNMFASGPRTSRGLAAVLCGFPDLGGKSVLQRTRAQGAFQSLFAVFAGRGYETSFLYGGDSAFDNMEGFFTSVGLQRMIDIDQMPDSAWRTDWGVADHVVFERADEEFTAAETPFFSVILTLTNHNPHEVPPGCIAPCDSDEKDARVAHTVRYADWALEQFFTRAERRDWFENTLFVLVADHGARFNPRRLVDVEGYRVPCLFYAPNRADWAGRTIAAACGQTDIAATLLAALGGDFSHGTFGRDLLALDPHDPGLALLRKDRCMALVRGNLTLVEAPDRRPILFRRSADEETVEVAPAAHPANAANMHRTAMGFYQSARELYLRQAYGAQPQ